MPYYSLLNNDERGDVEVFLAASLQCESCSGEKIVRLDEAEESPEAEAYHRLGCRDASRVTVTKLDWYYGFGSPGYGWEEEPFGPFDNQTDALRHAADALEAKYPVAVTPPPVRGVGVAPPLTPPTAPSNGYVPQSYREALGALDVARSQRDEARLRAARLAIALGNAAYTLEFLAFAASEPRFLRHRAEDEARKAREVLAQ